MQGKDCIFTMLCVRVCICMYNERENFVPTELFPVSY